jgi:hypothetical protein
MTIHISLYLNGTPLFAHLSGYGGENAPVNVKSDAKPTWEET